MKEDKILYQIRLLDKMIYRNVCSQEEKEQVHKILTPTQMQIIEYILEHEENDIYQKDLENILNLRRATVSGVLQTMEKNHLIERVINKEDTRTKKIILNRTTKKVFYKRLVKIDELEKKIVKNISEEDLTIFFKVILQMKKNIQVEQKKG